MTDEFPANSETARVATPEVMEGVSLRAPSAWRRLRESIFGSGLMGQIATEIVVPYVKDMIYSVITEGSSQVLYRDGNVYRGRSPRNLRSGSSYHRPVNRRDDDRVSRGREERSYSQDRSRSALRIDEFEFTDVLKAEKVLDTVIGLIEEYGQATVADLYSAIGYTPNFTDHDWGWTEVRGFRIKRRLDAFYLDLPKPQHLK